MERRMTYADEINHKAQEMLDVYVAMADEIFESVKGQLI